MAGHRWRKEQPGFAYAHVLGAHLFGLPQGNIGAIFFAVGSTVFAWLFLRGRVIPIWMAWLGVVASGLLVAVLPLQLAGYLDGTLVSFVWLPMLAYEVPLGIWLLTTRSFAKADLT